MDYGDSSRPEYWLTKAVSALGVEAIDTAFLGGSRATEPEQDVSDTDLFLLTPDHASRSTAERFRSAMLVEPELLVSTVSYKLDFGFRVRAAVRLQPEGCCSFFFCDRDDIRNVGPRRRGGVIWGRDIASLSSLAAPDPPADQEARREELVDSLLEIPSVIKYYARDDHGAAGIRLQRLCVGLLNYLTLDPINYEARTSKNIAQRLQKLGILDEGNRDRSWMIPEAQMVEVGISARRALQLAELVAIDFDRHDPEGGPIRSFLTEGISVLKALVHGQ